MVNILLTGGSGLLGKELRRYIKCSSPSHREFDIRNFNIADWKDFKGMVIHCAAYTDLVKAEKEKRECFNVNFRGTARMVRAFRNVPFVYISTEYVYNPFLNFYSLTKREAERYVRGIHPRHLIIRTLFKPRPFPHKMAFVNQYTTGDYVDVIAPLIVSAIMRWDKKTCQTIDVGTERKTMYELACRTRPDVKKGSIDDIKEVRLPKDYL